MRDYGGISGKPGESGTLHEKPYDPVMLDTQADLELKLTVANGNGLASSRREDENPGSVLRDSVQQYSDAIDGRRIGKWSPTTAE